MPTSLVFQTPPWALLQVVVHGTASDELLRKRTGGTGRRHGDESRHASRTRGPASLSWPPLRTGAGKVIQDRATWDGAYAVASRRGLEAPRCSRVMSECRRESMTRLEGCASCGPRHESARSWGPVISQPLSSGGRRASKARDAEAATSRDARPPVERTKSALPELRNRRGQPLPTDRLTRPRMPCKLMRCESMFCAPIADAHLGHERYAELRAPGCHNAVCRTMPKHRRRGVDACRESVDTIPKRCRYDEVMLKRCRDISNK